MCFVCVVCHVDVGVGLHGSSVSEFALVTSDVNLNVVIPGCDVQKVQ